MKTDIWMPIYIKDYLASTSRLNPEQHGIYLLLMFDYWINGPLPNDIEMLCNVVGNPKDNPRVLTWLLEKYFYLDKEKNVWKKERIETELTRASKNRETARENGKKGGRPKNPRVNPDTNPEKTSSPAPTPISSTAPTSLPENKKGFKKPTVQDIHDYMNEYGNKKSIKIDLLEEPDGFYDFYESKGWLIGKTKMIDWKATVRTWMRKNKNFNKTAKESISSW